MNARKAVFEESEPHYKVGDSWNQPKTVEPDRFKKVDLTALWNNVNAEVECRVVN